MFLVEIFDNNNGKLYKRRITDNMGKATLWFETSAPKWDGDIFNTYIKFVDIDAVTVEMRRYWYGNDNEYATPFTMHITKIATL